TDDDMAYLSKTYKDLSETLKILRNSPHGKAYTYCVKYRIFTFVSHDLSVKKIKIPSDSISSWMNENPRTWRNARARFKHAEDDLAMLQGAHDDLDEQQHKDLRVLKFLFEGVLSLASWENLTT